MIVPEKIANRCHARSSTPAGIGENQIIVAARTVIKPRKIGLVADALTPDLTPSTTVALIRVPNYNTRDFAVHKSHSNSPTLWSPVAESRVVIGGQPIGIFEASPADT